MHANESTAYEFPTVRAAQAAERLGISIPTLYRLMKKGAAPDSFKVAHRRYFRESDLSDFLEKRCRRQGGL